MSKINVVIDFNNILMRSLSIPGTTGYNSDYSSEEDIKDIIKKLAVDICYNIRLFIGADNVYVVCDSHNAWRKDILPDGSLGYKGNRVKDDTKNWDNLWNAVNEFKEIMKDNGIVVSEIKRAEADDLAALYKYKFFNEQKESVIFVSSDKDWRQLADFNNNTFVIIFNPTVNNKAQKKMFMTQECYDYIFGQSSSPVHSIFALSDSVNKDVIKNARKLDSKINIEIIDPHSVVISKIFEGDAGDNVPSYYNYYKTTKCGTVNSGVTPSQTRKLCEKLNITSVNDIVGNELEIYEALKTIMKLDELPIDPIERIERQRILVELNPDLFPHNIVKEFNELPLVPTKINNNLFGIKWFTMLNNTKFYSKEDDKPKTNKVFSDLGFIDELIKPLF